MRRPSLKIRITAWFALMMFVIEALVLSFLLAVNGTIVKAIETAKELGYDRHERPRVASRAHGRAQRRPRQV